MLKQPREECVTLKALPAPFWDLVGGVSVVAAAHVVKLDDGRYRSRRDDDERSKGPEGSHKL